MPRKAHRPSPSPSASFASASEQDPAATDPPASINPYTVLGLEETATPEQITKAYRLSALRNHPDKAPAADQREIYTRKFQEIAFAYAILSDPARRRRYDTTGNISESLDLDDDDFDWASYFKAKYEEVVSIDAIEKVKKEYQGSEEEKQDVLAAYEEGKGDLDAVFESVMCSDVFEDDERFRKIIDEAIKSGQVKPFKKYTSESKAGREKRRKKAMGEAKEAEELAEELGVREKLFGSSSAASGKTSKGKKAGAGRGSQDALAAIIQQRQKSRQQEDFFARLEQKYAPGAAGGRSGKSNGKSSGKKGAKRVTPSNEDDDADEEKDIHMQGADDTGDDGEPSEEAFKAMQERGKKNRDAREKKRMKVKR